MPAKREIDIMENLLLEISEKTSKNLTCYLTSPTYTNLLNILNNCDEKDMFLVCNYLLKINYPNIDDRFKLKHIIVIYYCTQHFIECLYYLNLYFSKYEKKEKELLQILLDVKIKTSYINPDDDDDIKCLEKINVSNEIILMFKVAANLRLNKFNEALELSYSLFFELKKNNIAYMVVIESAIKNNDVLLLIETLILSKKNNIIITLSRNINISARKLLIINFINILKKKND